MRILDEDTDRSIQTIVLYLTKSEAEELRDSLNLLLEDSSLRHEHVSSADNRREVTVCIYDPDNLEGLNERSKTLIQSE
jgi:hypothetical protein